MKLFADCNLVKVGDSDMANFVHFLGLLGHKFHMLRYIELKQIQNMKIDSNKRINLVSLKNIDIWLIDGQKSL